MKEFMSSVSPKGQITIPLEIRQQLGVKPKDKVVITVDGDEVTVRPAHARLAASYQAIPALKPPRTLKEITEIAHEDQAQAAVREGFGDH